MANITIGKDSMGNTLYIESVMPLLGCQRIILTSNKAKALHFDSIVDAERFASEHNIELFDANNDEDNTFAKYAIFC